MQKKSSLKKILPLLNASLFGLGGLIYFDSGKNFLAYCCLVAGIFMLLNLTITSTKYTATIFIISALIALLVAFDFWFAGKKYIQYAWLLVALVNSTTAIIYYRRSILKPNQKNQPEEQAS